MALHTVESVTLLPHVCYASSAHHPSLAVIKLAARTKGSPVPHLRAAASHAAVLGSSPVQHTRPHAAQR
jgi:hypothetical protein